MSNVRAEEHAFVMFARDVEPKLRHALVAAYGADRGLEATNDALLYGWRHWDRVWAMENPAGYLYRVGQSLARRRRLAPRTWWPDAGRGEPWVEPGLSAALGALSKRQRQVVVLTESFEFTHAEVAELLGISASSVQTHLERGLAKLRAALGVER